MIGGDRRTGAVGGTGNDFGTAQLLTGRLAQESAECGVSRSSSALWRRLAGTECLSTSPQARSCLRRAGGRDVGLIRACHGPRNLQEAGAIGREEGPSWGMDDDGRSSSGASFAGGAASIPRVRRVQAAIGSPAAGRSFRDARVWHGACSACQSHTVSIYRETSLQPISRVLLTTCA